VVGLLTIGLHSKPWNRFHHHGSQKVEQLKSTAIKQSLDQLRVLIDEASEFGACVPGPHGVQTQEFVIDNIPYEFAIPMLTGWDLDYGCSNDNNVLEIGASIDEFHYREPGDPPGRLRYKVCSVLRDENDPGFGFRHKVTILGIRFVGNGTPNQRVPDLVPFSPSGNTPRRILPNGAGCHAVKSHR
jgi:hypothetical protein